MKRIIVGLFILSSLFMFTSCGHEHDFGEVKVIKIATCTEAGLKESKCKTCGEIKTEELNSLEHVYESDNDASTEVGIDVQVCILCGEKRIVEVEELEFELNSSKKGYIVEGIGTYNKTEVVIPETYRDLPVVEIAYSAFKNNKNIVSVKIPNSVVEISAEVFEGCINLVNVELSDNVEIISASLFKGCTSLTSIKISDKVIGIRDNAFRGCTSLKEVIINEKTSKLDTIAEYAFYECTSLEKINLPNSIRVIYSGAFMNCSNLKEATIYKPWKMIVFEGEIFANCTSLKEFKVPEGVTKINGQFEGCISLETLELPNSLEEIGEFKNCTSLKNVSYNGTIEDWNKLYFTCYFERQLWNIDHFYLLDNNKKLYELTELVVPNTWIYVKQYAFSGIKSLTKVVIPKELGSIHNSAFRGCSNLSEVVFEKNSYLSSINKYAFADCVNLKTIIIPENTKEVGEGVFENCSNLKIYCEVKSLPKKWSTNWNISNCPVVWEYSE